LERVWDIDEISKAKGIKAFDKNSLVFNIMIRQPEFVTEKIVREIYLSDERKTVQEKLKTVLRFQVE